MADPYWEVRAESAPWRRLPPSAEIRLRLLDRASWPTEGRALYIREENFELRMALARRWAISA